MIETPENLSIENLVLFKYAPINSVDMERYFSMFKVFSVDKKKVKVEYQTVSKSII